MPATEGLPKLPLVCLKTADFKDTKEVVKGRNTVIGTLFYVATADASFFHADLDCYSTSITASSPIHNAIELLGSFCVYLFLL
jgi:hypothetical protein